MSELSERKRALLESAGANGRLGARERIAKLLDEGSFVELGTIARAGGDAPGVVTGFGTVEDRPVYLYAQEYSRKGAGMDAAQAGKITRVIELAAKTGAPLLAILDSAGAKLEEGVLALDAYAKVMAATARISGVVPSLALVLGPCVGGAAYIPGISDFVIAAQKASALFVTGPQVVSARTGEDISADALGGAEALAKSGAAHLAAKDEAEALALARKLLSFLPANNEEDSPLALQDDLNRQLDISSYADVHDLFARIADFNDFFELQGGYAKNLVTGLARLGGRTVGLLGNNPASHDGVLCHKAAGKAARFVGFCDSFNIPVLSFISTKGPSTVTAEQNAASIKAGAQLIGAYASATVPKISVICGDAVGSAYVALGSKELGADLVYAWPSAFIAPMEDDAAVAILNREEIKAGEDAEALREAYREKNDGFGAAEKGAVDDVIEPASTRQILAAALEALLGKREAILPRKHGNLPL
ncbi:MAG: methylmalonyl-CoA carboxyltransferase [Christensenellaceae bacterium]|jgi:acetyl-CoA carboxylase carboxyltransferase component|nr:methylmalonyl-CoA carboxyltransferase [Christensenellaceae bacterium]